MKRQRNGARPRAGRNQTLADAGDRAARARCWRGNYACGNRHAVDPVAARCRRSCFTTSRSAAFTMTHSARAYTSISGNRCSASTAAFSRWRGRNSARAADRPHPFRPRSDRSYAADPAAGAGNRVGCRRDIFRSERMRDIPGLSRRVFSDRAQHDFRRALG